MGYLHIDNLYKNLDILLMRECYALEKIHGTSAHVSWNGGMLKFFAGGVSYEDFVALFDVDALTAKFAAKFTSLVDVVIYGEAYGGKCQQMSATYGEDLRFVAFDVKVGDCWLAVPNAVDLVLEMGLEFVSYQRIPADILSIEVQRNADSVQAVRNGIGVGKMREGVVLRPLQEFTTNNGSRLIVKCKRDEFRETATSRELRGSPDEIAILTDAKRVADEWVTAMRLAHVLDKLGACDITRTKEVIDAMVEDVEREASGEIISDKNIRKAIGKATSVLFKSHLEDSLKKVV